MKTSNKQKDIQRKRVGSLGEELAARFLVKRGFGIVERNYLRKWGEIDIIAKKEGFLHFIEVKSASCNLENISRETNRGSEFPLASPTGQDDCFRPEENVHPKKLKRIKRAIQTYLADQALPQDSQVYLHVAVVYIDTEHKKAKVELLENVIVEE